MLTQITGKVLTELSRVCVPPRGPWCLGEDTWLCARTSTVSKHHVSNRNRERERTGQRSIAQAVFKPNLVMLKSWKMLELLSRYWYIVERLVRWSYANHRERLQALPHLFFFLTGSIWQLRKTHTVGNWYSWEIHQIRKGKDRDWTQLCKATQVSWYWERLAVNCRMDVRIIQYSHFVV